MCFALTQFIAIDLKLCVLIFVSSWFDNTFLENLFGRMYVVCEELNLNVWFDGNEWTKLPVFYGQGVPLSFSIIIDLIMRIFGWKQ